VPRNRLEWARLVGWVALGVSLFAVVGALTTLADRPEVEPWKAWTWALTSAATALPCTFICLYAVRHASPAEWGWPRAVVLHALAALAYTVLHVGGFVLLRKLVYAAMGDSYGAGPLLEEFPYELRKDLLTYGALVILFWLAGERQRRVREPAPPATFEIRDGARRLRVPVSDIVAVTSAGNYVEFRLADGRRPLMRATLASIEAALGAQGLIRVHRAWVIHPARVTALAPDGSGDWTVQLGDLAVPLSRRFPQALAALRTDAVPEAT